MSEVIKNRSEIVFLYDIKDANPNGDPLDENKPRIDDETGINIVTDVRLKRTIRDYLMNFIKGKEIFVREIIYDEEGHIQDAKLRAKDFVGLIGDEKPEEKEIITKFKNDEKISKKHVEIIKNNIRQNVVKKAIDTRLFGATIPLEFQQKEITEKISNPIRSSVTLTGPVQFRMGRSMHKVELKHIKGTGAFASKEGATQKTFREEDILPYSIISFYGVINENAAQHTKLTEDDVNLLLDGMWNGTKNLISRSKAGQMPRLLMKVNYKENNYHIGDLDKLIKLKSEKRDEEIRDISEVKLDASELVKTLNEYRSKIASIDIKVDDRVNIDLSGLDPSIMQNTITFE